MLTVPEYFERAVYAEAMAERATSAEERLACISLANQWRELAAYTIRTEATRPLTGLDSPP